MLPWRYDDATYSVIHYKDWRDLAIDLRLPSFVPQIRQDNHARGVHGRIEHHASGEFL